MTGSTADADGKDVAGTINGIAATGSGQFLSGAVDSAAEGLKLLINGGSTGARGSINFTRGYADQLNTLLDTFLEADGSFDAKMDGLQGRIDNVGEQREDLNRRIEALEIRYRAQFNALDALMAQLQSTSSFLTQQLVGLENLIKRK